jgi:transcriptional regulator with XRE-family HTH domain
VKPLAQFVSELREKLGLSQTGLAKRCALDLETIENIENGTELFLSSTVRQKLAKGLKLSPSEIKPYEMPQDYSFISKDLTEKLKEDILAGTSPIPCPMCTSTLVVRIVELYDLEDILHYHPKAHCSKCSFQLRERSDS